MVEQVSQASIDLCERCEVSSKQYYQQHYQQPEWPGEQSGITIGIGYDLGQASKQKIQADWHGRVPDAMLAVMAYCSGSTGTNARALLPQVRDKISVSWDVAQAVFLERDVPEAT